MPDCLVTSIPRSDKVLEIRPFQLRPAPAEEPLQRRIALQDLPIRRSNQHDTRRDIEDGAKARLGQRRFIKGNLDPVTTLLQGSADACFAAALERLAAAKPHGGYILSSACSVAPHTPPENILQLRKATEAAGWYDGGR